MFLVQNDLIRIKNYMTASGSSLKATTAILLYEWFFFYIENNSFVQQHFQMISNELIPLDVFIGLGYISANIPIFENKTI